MTFKEIMSVIIKKSPMVFVEKIKEFDSEDLESVLLLCIGYQGIIPPDFLKDNPEKELKWLLGKIFKNISFYFNKNADVNDFFKIINLISNKKIESEIELLDFFKIVIINKNTDIYFSLYHHIFIFFRIVLFIESAILFYEEKSEEIDLLSKRCDQNDIYFLDLIFYIMNIDGKIHKQEKKLFSQLVSFIDKKYTYKNIDIVNLLSNISELEKGMILEVSYKIAFLTTLIDKKEDKREIFLLKLIRDSWGITELTHSQIILDVANDVSINKKIIYQSKFNKFLKSFEKNIIKKVTSILLDNKDKIMNELSQTKEMGELINKKIKGEKLTKEEEKLIASQLKDILRTIPALGIFALPGGAILLPVLSKVLPFNILPSSFEKVELIEEEEDKDKKLHKNENLCIKILTEKE